MKLFIPIFTTCFLLCGSHLNAQPFTHITTPDSPIDSVIIRGFYRGCAWVDVDDDGDLDLTMQGWAFRNEGGGQFTTIESFGGGPNGRNDFLGGVSWADHDNDGDLDCLYPFQGTPDGINLEAGTIIFDNNGAGIFTEKIIDEDEPLATWSAAWGEYNNDGYVDVTCAVAFQFSGLATPAFFYKGNAGGTFTAVDTFEFTQNTAPYTVAFWTDYDRDGDSDLFLAAGPGGGPGPDFHYKNLLVETGTEGLERMTDYPWAMDAQDGQTYNFIDHDLDGDLDLYLTNYGGALNRFYENQNGTYVSVTNDLIFAGPMLGNCWGDFDNDGDQDVLLTADNVAQSGYFENQGGTFVNISNPFTSQFPTTGNVSGLTIGDYDNDGDLDFFANGGIQGQDGPRALYRNDLDNANHWVNIELEGNPSNRAGIGAVIYLTATIGGQTVTLQREVSAQNTFMGHNSLRQHFGLGDATVIDNVTIHWPSGNVDGYSNVPVDEFHTAIEGESLGGLTATREREILNVILEIRPNPVSGERVEIQNIFSENRDSVNVKLFSASGQILKIMEMENSPAWIELSMGSLSAGIYIVQISQGTKLATGKFVRL